MGRSSRIACLYAPALAPQADTAPATDTLWELALSFSPQVERTADCALLEVGDLGALYPSEQGLGTALWAQARKCGLEVHVCIASSAATARLLSRARPGVHVIPAGQEREALAPLPLGALPLTEGQAAVLHRFGVRTVGELAALPRRQLGARLGTAGVLLHLLASGEDRTPLQVTPRPEAFTEEQDLDDALDNLEPLGFLLRGLLDRVAQRLAERSLACARYVLQLDLDPHGRDERTIAPAAPTRDVATLLELGRVELATRPPTAAVRRLIVIAHPAPRRRAQLSLFEPPRPSPEKLSTTLARLEALCGPGYVGTPTVLDTYLPGQAHLVPFAESSPASTRSPRPGLHLAPHVLRPPRPAEVECALEGPAFIRAELVAGRVVCFAGPFRVRVGFGTPALRDYYDIEIEGGLLYRLFQDLTTRAWFLDARYD